MEKIGNQVKLPLQTAIRIALQGIRIRLGRSLVTISSVVLGIAFLMSVVTGELVKRGVADEHETQQKVNLMSTLVYNQVGEVKGKHISVAALGALNSAEKAFLEKLRNDKAIIYASGISGRGITSSDIMQLGKDAELFIFLGDSKNIPAPLIQLTEGMTQKVVLDSVRDRFPSSEVIPGITYQPFFGELSDQQKQAAAKKVQEEQARTVWVVIISLLVTVIGIANALLMSVTERFKEIGTMKCLGAMSSFIRQMFLIESALIGFTGSLLGVLIGVLFPLLVNGITLKFSTVLGGMNFTNLTVASIVCLIVGTILSILAAIYPANFAARMVPASALRSNV